MFAQSALLKGFLFISLWILMLIFLITFYNNGYGKILQEVKGLKEFQQQSYLEVMQKHEPIIYSEEKREQAHIRSKETSAEDLSPLESDVYDIAYEYRQLPNASDATKFQHDLYNTQWQTYENLNISFKLFGAYYDERASVPEGTVVRILAMIKQIDKQFPINYCRLWFETEQRYVVVPIMSYNLIWFTVWDKSDTVYYPYLLTCRVPALEKSIPKSISIISAPDKHATNNLSLIYEQPAANASVAKFAICVKGLNYTDVDISKRLVEWLELMRILGAEKIFIYSLSINANIEKILNFYEQQNYVQIQPLTLVIPENSRLNKRLNEVIPYNDCFYRNMYKYEYIINVDIDEVIMPLGNLTSWHDLANIAQQLQAQESESCPYGFAGICFQNVYFPNFSDDSTLIPSSMDSFSFPNSNFYMLQHMQKLADYNREEILVKCFHNTSQALTLHNHFALTWLESCRPATMSTQFAQLQHYRTLKTMPSYRTVVEDRSISRFKEQLVRTAMKVWRQLGLLS